MARQPAFGRRLKALRLRRGLSQADLARGALSASAVSLLEAGRREPTQATVEALAAQLGCNPALLADGSDTLVVADAARLVALGEIAVQEGRHEEAAKLFEDALSEGLGDPLRVLRARLGLAGAAEMAGRFGDALTALERLAADFAAERVTPPLAVTIPLARVQRAAGRPDDSRRTAAAALERIDQFGLTGLREYVQLAGVVVGGLADAGDITAAAATATAMLAGTEPVRSRREQAAAYAAAGQIAAGEGCELEALQFTERAARIMRQGEGMSSSAALRMSLAWLKLRQPAPDMAGAEELLVDARAELEHLGDLNTLVCCETQLSQVALAQKRAPDARRWAEIALGRSGPEVGGFELIHAGIALGESHFAAGAADDAVACYADAARQLAQFGHSQMTAMVWSELGRLFHEAGRPQEALHAYDQAVGVR
ncbi:tetratricopeptide repeat protein [Actinoplanes sp. NPDC023714]|uniref:helix-turn-helix domain-containing protein n=1 Tax=Actinoplanes sp. NPDC023714 TaxID=3154322 RepID=UPI0033FDEC59